MPDDAGLWSEILRGDQSAYRDLIDRHGRYLYGVARSLAGNSADAEDLVQETLVGALTGHFRGESSLRTWLVGILVRQAAGLRRKRWRWLARFGRPATQAHAESPPPELVVNSPTAAADVRLDLATMLEALSMEHRQVIVLRELEGLSYEEMASVLGVPRGTVESRLHRAREHLRQRFQEYQQSG